MISYEVTLHLSGEAKTFTYNYASESEARERFSELSNRKNKVTLVEVVLEKTTREELDRWQAPGYPF